MPDPRRLVRSTVPPAFATGERCVITELLNDPAIPEVSVAEARVAPGTTTQLHALSVREIYVVTAGTGTMEGGDGQRFAVGPGDRIDIPPGAPQRIANTGPSDLVFLCICLPRFSPAGYEALGD